MQRVQCKVALMHITYYIGIGDALAGSGFGRLLFQQS